MQTMAHTVQTGEVALPCLQGNQQHNGTVESSSSYTTTKNSRGKMFCFTHFNSNTITLLESLCEDLDLLSQPRQNNGSRSESGIHICT